MRKRLLAIGIMLLTIISGTNIVYAGSLNSYENEVISAAKLVYEYNGAKYQVDQTFIHQLTDYLSSDGIDLSAEQRDEVLALAFSNIEQGVKDGYLLPVEGQDQKSVDGEDSNQSSSSDLGNGTEAEDNASVTDTADSEADNGEAGSTSQGADQDAGAEADHSLAANSSKSQSSIQGDANQANLENVTPEGMINQIISGEQDNQTKGDTSSNVEAGLTDNLDQNIIKNTGFDLTNTFVTCIAIGVFMLVAFYVTIRSNLFAHNDE